MADSNYIDIGFIQRESMCVMGSYSIIINYFSDKMISINNVLMTYLENFNLNYFSGRSNVSKKRNETIVKHLHSYCQPINMRGFDFIANMHNTNEINTKMYCSIVMKKAGLDIILQSEIEEIKAILMEKDSLAMILYKVTPTIAHAIVLGYDEEKEGFFQRDSQKSGLKFSDDVFEKEITEYIVFTDY